METQTARPREGAGRRRRTWLAGAVVAVLAGAVAFALLGGDGDVRLDTIPDGVSARTIDGHDVFLVRRGDDVRVLLPDARHLPDDTLWWCPNEQIFFEVEHGSQFDADGRKIGGPARGGLNEHPAEVVDGKIVVDTDRVIEGRLTPLGERPVALDDVDWTRPFDSGPGSFCFGAVAPGED